VSTTHPDEEMIDLAELLGGLDDAPEVDAPCDASVSDRLFREGSAFTPVARDEICGLDSILEELDHLLDVCLNPEIYASQGLRPETGVLLYGPPGTGKTMLARYLATCASALFVAVRDIPTGRGIGPDEIRDIYARARAAAERTGRPVILFIDEVDGFVGLSEGTLASRAAAQLAVELDGMTKGASVVTLAVTNFRADIPNKLLRAGRLSRSIEVPLPGFAERAVLLERYLAGRAVSGAPDLQELARLLPPTTCAADVEEIVTRAHRRAVRRHSSDRSAVVIRELDIVEEAHQSLFGSRPSRPVDARERWLAAIHELGHALVAAALGVGVELVSIRPCLGSSGQVRTRTPDDLIGLVDTRLLAIRVGLAGVVIGDVAGVGKISGSEEDTRLATSMAAEVIETSGCYEHAVGFNINGLLSRKGGHGSSFAVSEALLTTCDRAILALLREGHDDARAILEAIGGPAILALADVLMVEETMIGSRFLELAEPILAATALPEVLPDAPWNRGAVRPRCAA